MDKLVGKVTHYYTRLGVAVLDLTDGLKIGDTIRIEGHTTECEQPVYSLEIEHQKVLSVQAGAEAALKVNDPVRRGDRIYKVVEQQNVPTT